MAVIIVAIHCFVCDAPARVFVKYDAGYFCCEKCTQEGDYVETRMTSPSRRSHSNRPVVWTPDRRGSSPRSYTSSSPGFRLSVWLRPRLYAPRLSQHHSQVADVRYWLTGPIRRHDPDRSVASRLSPTLVSLLSHRLMALGNLFPKNSLGSRDLLQIQTAGKPPSLEHFFSMWVPLFCVAFFQRECINILLLSAGITIPCSAQYCISASLFNKLTYFLTYFDLFRTVGGVFVVQRVRAVV